MGTAAYSVFFELKKKHTICYDSLRTAAYNLLLLLMLGVKTAAYSGQKTVSIKVFSTSDIYIKTHTNLT